MTAVLLMFFGIVCGATIVYFVFKPRRWRLRSREEKVRTAELDMARRLRNLEDDERSLASRLDAFREVKSRFEARAAEFNRKAVDYDTLLGENATIKSDLRNAATIARRQELDLDQSSKRQVEIEQRANLLAADFMKETQKAISKAMRGDNYSASRERLEAAIARCRGIGWVVSPRLEAMMLADLEGDYKERVRQEIERERQAELRARLREDRQRYLREQEVKRMRDDADIRERQIEEAIAAALARDADVRSEEVRRLQQQLADERAANQRTIPNIEITNRGSVYVISNIGSFGEGVFKIGLSGRDDPFERVHELGSASVPFPFDVHMMIETPDARSLEKDLHRAFVHCQVNKANPRKEFFRTTLEQIVQVVHSHHPDIPVTFEAVADEYRRSLTMSEADTVRAQQLVEEVTDSMPLPR